MKKYLEKWIRLQNEAYSEIRKVIPGPNLELETMKKIVSHVAKYGPAKGWINSTDRAIHSLVYEDLWWLIIRDYIIDYLLQNGLLKKEELNMFEGLMGTRVYNLIEQEKESIKKTTLELLSKIGWVRLYCLASIIMGPISRYLCDKCDKLEKETHYPDLFIAVDLSGALRYLNSFSLPYLIIRTKTEARFLEALQNKDNY